MTITDQINTQLNSLRDDLKKLTDTLKNLDVDSARKSAGDIAATSRSRATASYDDLVKKAEELVAQARDLNLENVQKRAEKLLD